MQAAAFEITEVDFQPIRPHQGLLGFTSLVLAHSLRLSGIAIYSRLDGSGIRLVYPERILPHGAKIELICPITRECGELLTKAVSEHIEQLAEKAIKTQRGGSDNGQRHGGD